MGRLPPLLKNQPRWVQVTLALVVPSVYGLFTGYILGHSESGYLILGLLGILGGAAAGFDHDGAGAGARRGLLGGSLFGIGILIGHEIEGSAAKADIPDPAILLLVITVGLGIALGALGGRLRGRVERAATAAA
jgi:hypothetical protein